MSGLTFSSGLPDQPPAGWGYSYMDHTGAYYMALAILMALHHRNVTGEGQWVDLSTVEAATTLNGPAMLDYTVNGRPARRTGEPNSNRSASPPMAPHGIYPAGEEDTWVAIACRDDSDWQAFGAVVDEPWVDDLGLATLLGRLAGQDSLDAQVAAWTAKRPARETEAVLQAAGVPAAVVQSPQQRIDEDPSTAAWGLWPEVQHSAMGEVRVDGLPVHLSATDWELARGGPCLGEHNERVFGGLLGLSSSELASLREEGVI
jgi:crotonobetainyl-CoA:carnitine CoA-transferase CaiB-like acyl-CoA transferase